MAEDRVEINLSRALKVKNRLVHTLAQLDRLITTYNSALEDNQEYDIRALYEERLAWTARLVELKTAINAANRPVQRLIFEMAEFKSLVGMLKSVDTKNGSAVEGYASTRVTYVAQLRRADVDREIKRVEREIDRLQDELDRFNYKTNVPIDPSVLLEVQGASGGSVDV